MEKNIVIIENNETAFKRLNEHVSSIGKLVVKFEELKRALITNTISEFVDGVIEKYGRTIVTFLIDLNLNEKNCYGGLEIIKDIRKIDPKKGEDYWRTIVPIIVCTSYPDMAQDAYNNGANYVIEKERTLETGDDAIKQKKTWEKRMNVFLGRLIPKISDYSDWYSSAIEKIEKSPVAIKEGAINFFKKNNDPDIKLACVMTAFDDEHKDIINNALTNIRDRYYIETKMANKPYGEASSQLLNNIQCFMHCCDFGIGIFYSDPRTNSINANVALEVGYMLGINKKICYLKDHELEKINVDLVSYIVTEYNKPTSIGSVSTMEDALLEWIEGLKDELKIKTREK
jgi:hypothetical protein